MRTTSTDQPTSVERDSQQTVLKLDRVGLCFDRRGPSPDGSRVVWALKDISFDVRLGESIGVIGRNAAGKSTLLRVLAGVIEPDRGTVTSAGLRSSLLTLQLGFLNHLSGRENAMLSGMLMGMTKQQIRSRMPEILEFAGIGAAIDDQLSTYSTGMRTRLGFSVAYHAIPDVLLIDEILGVGDADFRDKSTRAMREILASNRTVVLVSHSPNMIRTMCDRAVWIEAGVTQLIGAATDVVDAYENHVKACREAQKNGQPMPVLPADAG